MSKYEDLFPKSFFQIISQDGLFGEWNPERNNFVFELRPEIFEKYSYKEQHMYGYDYSGGFLQRLNELEKLGVMKYYELVGTFNYNKEDYINYFKENGIPIGKNFFYSYEEEGGIYLLEYSIEKLSLLKTIIFNGDKNINIKKQLFKNILFLYEKESSNWDINREKPTIFDCEIIADELKLDDDYIFNDFSVLLTSICLHPNKKYTAELLNYLLENIEDKDKSIIENPLRKYGENFYIMDYPREDYFGEGMYDEQIRETYEYTRNVLYKKEENIATQNLHHNNIVYYNEKNNTLTYNGGNPCSFYGAPIQKNFIEKLYKNINRWVTKEAIGGNPTQVLSDIRKKLKTKGGGGYSTVDTKKLFQSFDGDDTTYFIMIG